MGGRFSSSNKVSQADDVKTSNTSQQPISAPVHLFAAGSAAAISAVSTQPLEVLKIRLQTNVLARRNIFANLRHIFRSEGVGGLYRGLLPTLGSVVPSISIYFTLYNSIKAQFGCPSGEPVRDIAVQSASAGLASSATAAITNPLWLVKTRLQAQPIYKSQTSGTNRSSIAIFRAILQEEGVRGLYKGLGASFLASTQAMVQFPIYEELKALMCSSEHTLQKSTCCYFGASAISASLACILTYPAEVVRARLQAQHGHVRKYNGILHAFRKIWAHEGAVGLYRGLFTSILKMTPAHAISFTAYEFILRTITTYNVPDLSAPNVGMSPVETLQYTFRPFFPPKVDFNRLSNPCPRYSPRTNPYTFAPSFTHIIASRFPSTTQAYSSSSASVMEDAKRWSEYFW